MDPDFYFQTGGKKFWMDPDIIFLYWRRKIWIDPYPCFGVHILGSKIRKEWDLDNKKRPNYIENTVKIWRDNTLPAFLQTLHLKLINNNLMLNNQTKHWLTNNNLTKEERGRCTFCSLEKRTKRGAYEAESLRHFFLECKTSVNIINHCTTTFKISRPNLKKMGNCSSTTSTIRKKWKRKN